MFEFATLKFWALTPLASTRGQTPPGGSSIAGTRVLHGPLDEIDAAVLERSLPRELDDKSVLAGGELRRA